MTQKILNFLSKFHIVPKKMSIYLDAFIHPTYANDKKIKTDFQRLEFLGDAVISMQVAEHLYNKYKNKDEGQMTRDKILMIQSRTFVKAAKDLGLMNLVKLSDSVLKNANNYDKVYEDTFEAFIGAVYLDQGLIKVKKILKNTIIHYFETNALNLFKDYKSLLQQLTQTINNHAPQYVIEKKEKNFVVSVYFNKIKYASAINVNSKFAEQSAAMIAYRKIAMKYNKEHK
ncbi:MAG: ribonuclease III [Mycoplasmataceae bacterium]|jgi:ribonuclease-3|nr:ribonuclease III [Mycoplasmataceae bacterium]